MVYVSIKLTSAAVRPLTVDRRGVVGTVKELDELAIADRAGLIRQLDSLGVTRCSTADFAVRCHWGGRLGVSLIDDIVDAMAHLAALTSPYRRCTQRWR